MRGHHTPWMSTRHECTTKPSKPETWVSDRRQCCQSHARPRGHAPCRGAPRKGVVQDEHGQCHFRTTRGGVDSREDDEPGGNGHAAPRGRDAVTLGTRQEEPAHVPAGAGCVTLIERPRPRGRSNSGATMRPIPRRSPNTSHWSHWRPWCMLRALSCLDVVTLATGCAGPLT